MQYSFDVEESSTYAFAIVFSDEKLVKSSKNYHTTKVDECIARAIHTNYNFLFYNRVLKSRYEPGGGGSLRARVTDEMWYD